MRLQCPRCGGRIELVTEHSGAPDQTTTATCTNLTGCGYEADENGEEIDMPEVFVSVPDNDWNART